jgi:hypothetical protein
MSEFLEGSFIFRRYILGEVRLDTGVGYYYFYNSKHPLANKSGKVYVHRVVASEKIGRWLTTDEHVHHIDGNRKNNSPENITVLSASEHATLEQKERGNVSKIINCAICGNETKNEFCCSDKCRVIFVRKVENRPSLIQLKKDLKTTGYVGVGRKYGVTDNCIRKWLRSYGADPKEVR